MAIVRGRPALGMRRLQGDGENPGAVGDALTGRAGANAVQAPIAEPPEHAVIEFERALHLGDREIDVAERASDHSLLRRGAVQIHQDDAVGAALADQRSPSWVGRMWRMMPA